MNNQLTSIAVGVGAGAVAALYPGTRLRETISDSKDRDYTGFHHMTDGSIKETWARSGPQDAWIGPAVAAGLGVVVLGGLGLVARNPSGLAFRSAAATFAGLTALGAAAGVLHAPHTEPGTYVASPEE